MGIWNPYAGGPVASPVLLPDGSAAAPSLSFINSPTTGIYRSAANVLAISTAGTLRARWTAGGSFYQEAALIMGWWGRTGMESPADGNLLLHNDAGNDFGRLQFGGTAATFPSLKRSTTEIHARLADDSANTDFLAAQLHVTVDSGGAANRITFPYGYDEAARSTGVGTILFDDAVNRNSVGFAKMYVNGNARWFPYFDAI
jgi:hypothetical protein